MRGASSSACDATRIEVGHRYVNVNILKMLKVSAKRSNDKDVR